MRERKPAVDLRLILIFRSEKIVKLLFRVDPERVRISKLLGAIVKVFLDVFQNCWDLSNKLAAWSECLLFGRLIPPRDSDRPGGKITRTKLDADRYPALDPFPILHPAANITLI